jgi:hypothetical protein
MLTQEEIIAKYGTPVPGAKNIREAFLASYNAFAIDHGDFLHMPIDRVRMAGTPMTEAEAAAIEYWRHLEAAARGDQHETNNDSAHKNLEWIKASLNNGEVPRLISVRELLRWFGVDNPDDQTINIIHQALRKHNLRTEPDFAEQDVNGTIAFHDGSEMTDQEAMRLDRFHAMLIRPRVIDQCPDEPRFAEVWNKYAAMMQQTKIEDFRLEEVEAANIALSAEDFIRNGCEPENASGLAKALHGYVRGYQKLEHIVTSLKNGTKIEPITVRELLHWFGAERRRFDRTGGKRRRWILSASSRRRLKTYGSRGPGNHSLLRTRSYTASSGSRCAGGDGIRTAAPPCADQQRKWSPRAIPKLSAAARRGSVISTAMPSASCLTSYPVPD